MVSARDDLVAKVVPALATVPAAAWDACANPDPTCHNPFLSYAFLSALELAGCAVAAKGWAPQHIVLERGGNVIGCLPLYLKSHSRGEYVFDTGWADAYARAGGDYYPKLQAAVPFTPVPGRRLLIHPDADTAETELLLIAAARDLATPDRTIALAFLPARSGVLLLRHGDGVLLASTLETRCAAGPVLERLGRRNPRSKLRARCGQGACR